MAADVSNPAIPGVRRRGRAEAAELFERYLSVWVVLCMVAGVALGRLAPELIAWLRRLEFGSGSQINAPIAVLIWLMIVPMMMKIDFASLAGSAGDRRGCWSRCSSTGWSSRSAWLPGLAVLPDLFLPLIGEELAKQYTAGVIILAAAPCTAMVFVWSYLTDGDPAYTLVQVAVNDLIMLVLFAPLVRLLVAGPGPGRAVRGAADGGGGVHRRAADGRRGLRWLVRTRGQDWFERRSCRGSSRWR